MSERIKVGINGFGRIGKCIFLQLLEKESFDIKIINTSLDISSIEKYINRDSVHGRRNYKVEIFDDSIVIKNHTIKIVNSRILGEIDWRGVGADYLFETTGAYLTKDQLVKHQVDNVLLSSPPKDDTEMFCYGVNHEKYNGEKIISCGSCTTNCISPILKFCIDCFFSIDEGSFITIHSATSSQSTVDTGKDKTRTNRSIFNNIIPHTTGASKSIDLIIPEIKGKVKGTSARIPISNVSMIDLNIRFTGTITKDIFFKKLEKYDKKDIISVNMDNCVSSDFIGCDKPTIVDYNSTIEISDRSLKIQLWYDNEWSYAAQVIRMCNYLFIKNEYFLKKLLIKHTLV